jgi:ribosomal protein S12 methylthiotransferase accessory factor
LPAHRVFLDGIDHEAGVATGTSTGLACHVDPWRALRSSLVEVIERDAVMVSWLTRSSFRPLHAPLRWRSQHGTDIRFDLAVENYRLYRLDSPAGIPVAFVVTRGGRIQPPLAVGAAAHPDLVLACRKALIDAQQTLGWARHMLAQRRPVPPTAPRHGSGSSEPCWGSRWGTCSASVEHYRSIQLRRGAC